MRFMEHEVQVALEEGPTLAGSLVIPPGAEGLVLFAHGSGSSRFSPRNRYVADVLQAAGLATLLIDLLTGEEEESEQVTRHLRFDIELLAERLLGARRWLRAQPLTGELGLGYFGSSTGAAAALVAAAREPEGVGAVVSRGGRPDLARGALAQVKAPTLLIVGSADSGVVELNAEALERLNTYKSLLLVPGATHLFQEPGALQEVSGMARDWFVRHLTRHEEARPQTPGP